jgi:ABC-type multidrug transport system fused ATPase/permease subunit
MIMVLDKGRVIELDTPQALLATTTSVFYGMADAANLL